tara:strand:+ start:2136 stop:2924 length:789 start_codon:yes stop_codon:yes gene_type:complete
MIKYFVNRLLGKFNLEVKNKHILDISDDPIEIIKRIFSTHKVNTIIDGGASIGDISLKFANYFPKSNVYCFEPYSDFNQFLTKRFKDNERISIFPFALNSTNDQLNLYINNSKGTNSTLPPASEGVLIYGNQFDNTGVEITEAISLDSWAKQNDIDHIDILKLDVQGTELDVLKGANHLLSNNGIDALLIEINFQNCYRNQSRWDDLISYLMNSGYSLFNFYNFYHYEGKLVQSDAIFFRNDFLETINISKIFHNRSNILLK